MIRLNSYFKSLRFVYSLLKYNGNKPPVLIIKRENYDGLNGENPPMKIIVPPKPKNKILEKQSFSNNSVLNDVLNETAASDEWKTLGGSEFTSDRMNELVGGQYGNMMNQQSQQVPSSDPMSQFVNKDYREVLKKSKKNLK